MATNCLDVTTCNHLLLNSLTWPLFFNRPNVCFVGYSRRGELEAGFCIAQKHFDLLSSQTMCESGSEVDVDGVDDNSTCIYDALQKPFRLFVRSSSDDRLYEKKRPHLGRKLCSHDRATSAVNCKKNTVETVWLIWHQFLRFALQSCRLAGTSALHVREARNFPLGLLVGRARYLAGLVSASALYLCDLLLNSFAGRGEALPLRISLRSCKTKLLAIFGCR